MKVGIALSGGLAKGAYQFGFLKALLTVIPLEDIEIVSSSSIGILNAYGLCAGKMDEVEKIWRESHFDNVFKTMKACWFQNFIGKTFKNLMVPEDNVSIPFYATITYLAIIPVGRYYLIEGPYSKVLPKFSRAAIGFPLITGPVRFFRGLPTIDGGACDNIPIYPLMEYHDLDLIICIHFDSQYLLKESWQGKKTVIVDIDASLGNSLRKQSFNFRGIVLNKMVDAGYEYGIKICEKLFKDGYDNIDSIRTNAHNIYLEEFDERMINGSIDRFVTTLNYFSQAFRRKPKIKPLIKRKVKK